MRSPRIIVIVAASKTPRRVARGCPPLPRTRRGVIIYPNPAAATPYTAGITTARVGIGFLIRYVLAIFGVWTIIITPANVTLALKAQEVDPSGKGALYGVASLLGGLAAILTNPLVGRLSDRTRSRFGRRRPWIAFGILGALLSAVLMAGAQDGLTLTIAWVLMQTTINAAIAPLVAILADRFPRTQRGTASGFVGLTYPAGLLMGTYFVQLFPENTWVQVMLPAAFGALIVLVFLLTYNDKTVGPSNIPPFSTREFFGSFVFDPAKNPALARVVAASFLLFIGIGVYQSYSVYFLQDHLGISPADVARVTFFTLLVSNTLAVIVAPLAGLATDRIGRVVPFIAAIGCVTVSLVIMAVGTLPIFLVGAGLAGIGLGAFKGSYLVLSTDSLSDTSTAARDLGIVNIAFTIPGTAVPSVAPFVLAIGGGQQYVLLWLLGAGFTVLAFIPLIGLNRRLASTAGAADESA